jgi:hypothetical protein
MIYDAKSVFLAVNASLRWLYKPLANVRQGPIPEEMSQIPLTIKRQGNLAK